MKKPTFALVLAGTSLLCLSSQSLSATITVAKSGGTYATIQAGVSAANAGDTVRVQGFGNARLVQADPDNDLALLKVEPQKPVPFLKVRTEPAKLGQDVVVFGYPLASFLDNGLNVTTGDHLLGDRHA